MPVYEIENSQYILTVDPDSINCSVILKSGKDGAYTHAILNGDPVYCPIDADKEQIKEAEYACSLAEKLAFCEMIKHEFISDDCRKQRTTFSDGTVIEVDFDKEEYKVYSPDN